jgi:hypothetical protein
MQCVGHARELRECNRFACEVRNIVELARKCAIGDCRHVGLAGHPTRRVPSPVAMGIKHAHAHVNDNIRHSECAKVMRRRWMNAKCPHALRVNLIFFLHLKVNISTCSHWSSTALDTLVVVRRRTTSAHEGVH